MGLGFSRATVPNTLADPGVGRILLVYAPGSFEGFFRRLAAAEAKGDLGEDAYAVASEEFGITWL